MFRHRHGFAEDVGDAVIAGAVFNAVTHHNRRPSQTNTVIVEQVVPANGMVMVPGGYMVPAASQPMMVGQPMMMAPAAPVMMAAPAQPMQQQQQQPVYQPPAQPVMQQPPPGYAWQPVQPPQWSLQPAFAGQQAQGTAPDGRPLYQIMSLAPLPR